MHIELFGHVLFDGVKEAAKLCAAVTAMHLTNDVAGLGIQCSEQTGGAVAQTVVSTALGLCPGRMGSSGEVRSRA